MKVGYLFVAIFVWIAAPTWAEDFAYRQQVAAADTRLASEWLATAYEIPARVPQEMLFAGYSYAETLVALSMVRQGASLNEVLELRGQLGGHRWRQIAATIELNADALPIPVQELLWFGRNKPASPVLHFLPDVYPGLAHDLRLHAFSPTVPSPVLVSRFKLNDDEVANIRAALDDPLGIPRDDLLEPAGKGLLVADWVLAGAVSQHKPFPMESLLAARLGEDLAWSEIALAFGLRPNVLTQGPLSGIYPVLTGTTPGTILTARRRSRFPKTLPLSYDLERLTPSEKRALYPIMVRAYRVTQSEQGLLSEAGLEFAEQGLAVALARLAELDLSIILQNHQGGDSWSDIIRRYAIDTTGQDALLAAIEVRQR